MGLILFSFTLAQIRTKPTEDNGVRLCILITKEAADILSPDPLELFLAINQVIFLIISDFLKMEVQCNKKQLA